MTVASLNKGRSLLIPGVAALIALAILLSLGTWQMQRKAWKESLIQQIETRAYGEPGAILPESEWARWHADQDEFRKVRVTGTFLHDLEAHVYGLAPGTRQGAPIQGYYILTPLRLATGGIVMINRGFVPTDLKNPATRPQSQPSGQVTVTGLVRAPEARNIFTPNDDLARNLWFARNPQAIAAARGLESVAPFLIDADATPNPGGWPRGGQTPLTLPNNHLQYAVTWYGIALTLVAVFAAFAWRRIKG
ncbi:SURF1 family protein [Microvirga guangxiensis]|uniref:SURF1-like protein n=1 Tax=Microvirga guangxiensis TaxID=549386 RepID=A0A1G5JMN7_9HYPH|nr:SURF1 family protein [Microvirga guangxiensis]SCY89009.1 surfeit locus 1 family protein [Microvirga guangxiensis]